MIPAWKSINSVKIVKSLPPISPVRVLSVGEIRTRPESDLGQPWLIPCESTQGNYSEIEANVHGLNTLNHERFGEVRSKVQLQPAGYYSSPRLNYHNWHHCLQPLLPLGTNSLVSQSPGTVQTRSKHGQHGHSGSWDGKMWFDQQ